MSTRHTMGSADAAWLRMDRPENLMVIHAVMWFDEQPDWDRLREVIRERLVEPYPRFRQRAVGGAPVVGRPAWEDDPAFDLDLHLHRVALPEPGDDAALQAFVADRMVVPLDHSRPLWEYHLIDGYRGGAAVLARIHHAIADGVALARVMLSLTDATPEDTGPPLTPPDTGHPHRGPLDAVLRPAAAALGATRAAAGALLHEGVEVVTHPKHTIDLAAHARDDAQALAKLVFAGSDADTVLRGHAGIGERVAWSPAIELRQVKDLAHDHGATVNDVLVAALTGGLRDYLVARDSLVDGIRVLVPFNLRGLDEPLPRDLGNRFGLVTLPLAVGLDRPLGRLRAVMREMAKIKTSPEGIVSYAILSTMGSTPAQVESALVDLFSSSGSAVVTNVPGPREPVYLAGTEVTGVLVWAPVSGNMAMSVSIFSYAGTVRVGVMTDAGLIPDPEAIVAGFTAELDRLAALPASA
jgi:WS/DGAT/MGAT family acyltransferase